MSLHVYKVFLLSHNERILFLIFNLILNLFKQILFGNNYQKEFYLGIRFLEYILLMALWDWACLHCVVSTWVWAQALPLITI